MFNSLPDSVKKSLKEIADAAENGRNDTMKELSEHGLRPPKPLNADAETDGADEPAD